MSSPTRPGVWLPETLYLAGGEVHEGPCDPFPAVAAEDLVSPRWCPACFPGNRCTVCGRPSGDLDQCGPCLHAATTLDKAIEARTSG